MRAYRWFGGVEGQSKTVDTLAWSYRRFWSLPGHLRPRCERATCSSTSFPRLVPPEPPSRSERLAKVTFVRPVHPHTPNARRSSISRVPPLVVAAPLLSVTPLPPPPSSNRVPFLFPVTGRAWRRAAEPGGALAPLLSFAAHPTCPLSTMPALSTLIPLALIPVAFTAPVRPTKEAVRIAGASPSSDLALEQIIKRDLTKLLGVRQPSPLSSSSKKRSTKVPVTNVVANGLGRLQTVRALPPVDVAIALDVLLPRSLRVLSRWGHPLRSFVGRKSALSTDLISTLTFHAFAAVIFDTGSSDLVLLSACLDGCTSLHCHFVLAAR